MRARLGEEGLKRSLVVRGGADAWRAFGYWFSWRCCVSDALPPLCEERDCVGLTRSRNFSLLEKGPALRSGNQVSGMLLWGPQISHHHYHRQLTVFNIRMDPARNHGEERIPSRVLPTR